MNVKPIPAATTYAISSSNGATDGNARREEKEKKQKQPDAKLPDVPATASDESESAPAPSLSQMVDSEKVVELLNARPTTKNRDAFVKNMAPPSSKKSLIDVKKLDKSF